MKIAPRSYGNRLRPLLRGRPITLARRLLAAGLLVLAAVLATRPSASGPAAPAPPRADSPSEVVRPGPGFSTVPVRLADPGVAELLTRGMRVDLVTLEAGERTRKVLADMATVIDVRSPPPAAGVRLLGAEGKGPLVLVSVPAELAPQVAAAALRNPVAVTFR